MPSLSLAEVADLVRGRLDGADSARRVVGVATLQAARPDQLSLVAGARYASYVDATRAAAVLTTDEWAARVPSGIGRVVVPDPHVALAELLPVLHPEPLPEPGVHPAAVVAASAQIGPGASVGPFAVIGEGCVIGEGTRIASHCVVDGDCRIGRHVVLHPGAVLHRGVHLGDRVIIHSGARIGADGFGYVWNGGKHRKIPQVGGCILGDEVEIGANATVDRGSIGDTVIGRGTKIDNLVHIGHNVEIGEHVIIIAQVGISGSTRVGNGAVLAGQAGIAGHISIGAGARVGAQAGVFGDVPPHTTVSGYPARPHRESLRASAAVFRLPQLAERVRRLEQAISTGSDS